MMDYLKDDFDELNIGSTAESFQAFLVSQRELFHSQIDQFQKIVVTQCKLAGVHPLSQEMAAGTLSIKIGKRPRDLLNPKAVNRMQSIFYIKDAISKKESCELSALFGITVTQIREFFTSQRSRVRRLVQLSRESAIRFNSSEEARDGFPNNSNSTRPINPAPLYSAGPTFVEDASCSTHGLDDFSKHFVDNIFILMQNEETFFGQEKLMEWILKIQNHSVLCWFLSNGGVMILANWLSEATAEEQTSVLLIILKVLCHLPLQKALPSHMSAILHSVNTLQFYRTSDISSRAMVLLSKLSKLLARNQAIKKPHVVQPSIDAQKEIVLIQSFGQIMGAESWHSHIGVPEDVLALSNEASDNVRKVEAPQVVKLLPAFMHDSPKKPLLGVSSSQSKERRKVLLVDQPGSKTMSRAPQATRAGPVIQGRPMSADDIRKAKKRTLFLQSKYGKTGSSKESKKSVNDSLHKPQANQASVVASLSKVPSSPKIVGDKERLLVPSKVSNMQEASLDSKQRMNLKLPFWEKCKRVQIPWKTPAELKLKDACGVPAGENSREVDVEKNRNRREKEAIYQTLHEIPSNPKEPWDLEINYDDTLTPEIPLEQQRDGDGDVAETPVAPNQGASPPVQMAATSSSNCNAGAAEPDLELLAVLLKNPDLVFALTSGPAGNLPSQEIVKLLDMIKKGDANVAADINGTKEKVGVSLPSPTPSSDPRTSGWRIEESIKNPFVRQISVPDRIQIPATGISVQPTRPPPAFSSSGYPNLRNNSPTIQTTSSDIGLTVKNESITATASSVNLASIHSPLAMPVDGTCNLKPIHNSSVQEGFSNSFPQSFALPLPTPSSISAPQQIRHPNLLQREPYYHTPLHSYLPKPERQDHVPDLRRDIREDMYSNYHSQRNQSNYNAMVGGSRQPGSRWERNDNAGEEFESWSPENSSTRDHSNNSRRYSPELRMNPQRNYRSEWSRQEGSSRYWDNSGRQGNRRWHGHRR